MSLAALSMMLAAVTAAPQSGARELATATVQIVEAEEIRFNDWGKADLDRKQGAKVKQQRVRDRMPLVEFY